MPTVVVNVSNQRVLVTAAVSLPTERGDNDPREFEALVDTGAQCTMVTRRVVERVGAEQIGIRQFMPASGQPQATALYRFSIAVPVSETDAEGIPSFTFARGGQWAPHDLRVAAPTSGLIDLRGRTKCRTHQVVLP